MPPQEISKNGFESFQYINLSKASPDAICRILDALNTEVEEAVRQKRYPLLEKAFEKLAPTAAVTVMM